MSKHSLPGKGLQAPKLGGANLQVNDYVVWREKAVHEGVDVHGAVDDLGWPTAASCGRPRKNRPPLYKGSVQGCVDGTVDAVPKGPKCRHLWTGWGSTERFAGHLGIPHFTLTRRCLACGLEVDSHEST